MDTIKVKVNHIGDVKINNEYTQYAPFEMIWFKDNELILETDHEKIIITPSTDTTITPKTPENNLTPVKNIDVKVLQNNVAKYLVINNKKAYRLPESLFQ